MMKLRWIIALLVSTLLAVGTASACPFCGMQGQTFTKEASQAGFVVYGLLTNPTLTENGGTTELIIDEKGIIKDDPFLKGKKSLILPKYIPVDKNEKTKFVVFCDIFQGQVDPYRGIPVKDPGFVDYLKGAMAVKDDKIEARLRYFFKYLGSGDNEIAVDAFKEFGNADGKEVMAMADQVRKDEKARAAMAGQLVDWLKNAETPAYRFGLYGYLLGCVGKAEDAVVLHDVLTDVKRGLLSGVDGVLAGYIKLQPKEGYDYLCSTLAHSKGKDDFNRRYAALRTVRFFWTDRPDVLKQDQLLKAVRPMLDQSDVADFIIEDLRKWKQWQLIEDVLALHSRESHNIPIIKRAVLRFAISCPDAKARKFVEEQRKIDKQRVEDAEELIKLQDG